MPPRLHNALSYSVAALSLPLTLLQIDLPRSTNLAVALWVFHFMRRTVESLWVHRYSGRPVPWSDALVEYVYYWGFGIWIAFSFSASPGESLPWLQALGVVLVLVGEFGNARAHWTLRQLRSQSGVAQRVLPQGGLFDLVDCPHYLFEILSWLGFAMVTNVLASWVFVAAVTGILCFYAHSRHKRYLEEFDGRDGRPAYPAGRRALVPGLF